MMSTPILCICTHSVFRHILLVGNCVDCPEVARNKHQAHCTKFRDPVFIKERKKHYDLKYKLRRIQNYRNDRNLFNPY